jgi:hypothetical protein
MTTEAGPQGNGGKIMDSVKKEWRRPELQKLPIAATAAGSSKGDEGNTKKISGTAGGFS